MSPERKLTEYFLERAKALGWLPRKLSWVNRRGAPDWLVLRAGVVRFVELKAPRGVLEPSQELEFPRLLAAGADLRIARNKEEVEEALA